GTLAAHALAVVQLRIAMQILPQLDDHLSYNGKKAMIRRYLDQVGLKCVRNEDDTIDRILKIVNSLTNAQRGIARATWSSINYKDRKRLLESQNQPLQSVWRATRFGSNSSPAQPISRN